MPPRAEVLSAQGVRLGQEGIAQPLGGHVAVVAVMLQAAGGRGAGLAVDPVPRADGGIVRAKHAGARLRALAGGAQDAGLDGANGVDAVEFAQLLEPQVAKVPVAQPDALGFLGIVGAAEEDALPGFAPRQLHGAEARLPLPGEAEAVEGPEHLGVDAVAQGIGDLSVDDGAGARIAHQSQQDFEADEGAFPASAPAAEPVFGVTAAPQVLVHRIERGRDDLRYPHLTHVRFPGRAAGLPP